MIKNKVVDIKIIFKAYLKILKTFYVLKQTFILQNIIELFSKTFLKYYFFRTVMKNSYQTMPNFFLTSIIICNKYSNFICAPKNKTKISS